MEDYKIFLSLNYELVIWLASYATSRNCSFNDALNYGIECFRSMVEEKREIL